MPQVTGIVKVYVDGTLRRSHEGAKLDLGGYERTMQTGHKVYGYSEKVVPAKITFEEAHMADTDLIELKDMVDATAKFECDTGVNYLITNACTTKTLELSGGDGKVSVEIQGDPAEEE